MPELPEVQTFINQLNNQVCHLKITKVSLFLNKLLKNSDYPTLEKSVVGAEITHLSRLGKYLIFHLDNNKVLVLHLRMEGKPFCEPKSQPYDQRHVLLIIEFANDTQLRYHDTRRFGTLHLYDESNYLQAKELSKLGLDPTDRDFDVHYVTQVLTKSPNKTIKGALLDQTKISGIGNIYADEICFAAKIDPRTLVKALNRADFQRITTAAQLIIKNAISAHGTTILSFKYRHNQQGNYQDQLMVHTLQHYPCKVCHHEIIKIKVNNRGTYLCQKCQTYKS